MRYSFEEIFSVSSGLSKKKGEFGTGNPFVSFKEVFSNTFLPKKLTQLVQTNEVEQQKYSVKKGDLFLTRTSEKFDELAMGSIALKDYPKATFNGFTKRLRLKQKYQELFDIKYLAYYMRSPFFRNQIISMTTMSTRASLNNEMISRLFIDIPKLETQKKISNILYILDSKIELNNQMIATLEELAATLFKRWFVDFEFPDENGNPYKSSGGKMVNSELGEIPEGWEVKTFSSIMKIRSGKRPECKSDNIENDMKIPIVGASKIMGYTNKYLTNTSIITTGRVGTHGVIQRFRKPVWISDNSFIITSSFEGYTYEFLKSIDFKSLNRGSTQPLITQTDIKNIKFTNPHDRLLHRFETIYQKVFKNIEYLSCEIESLIEIRDTLLPQLISGKLVL